MVEKLTNPLPTESNHFKARYAPWLGGILLSLGLLNLALALWVMLLQSQFNIGLITGVALTAAGYLYLTRPYFAIAPNRLTIYNLLGSTVKRYPFTAFSDISLEGNQIYIRNASEPHQKESVKLTKWITKGADWKTLDTITHQPSNTAS
ncbi:MAG: hypothetical protein AAGJ95_18105 [Cyanobacteria bacterium J06554_11]